MNADLSSPTMDRGSDDPLHHQLRQLLSARIQDGDYEPGQQLPGELVLCQQYGVSRTVVRQALADLEYSGVIERRRGRGTFVAVPRVAQGLVQHLGGLHDDIQAMGRTLNSEVRGFTIALAESDVAQRLGLTQGTPVVELTRLRSVDGEPWVYTVSHIPVTLAPDLVTMDMSEQSLYQLLASRYGISLVSSDRSVEACRADTDLAAALEVEPGDPVLKLTSVGYTDGGVAAETFVAYHRADRSRFEVHLTKEANVNATSSVKLVTTTVQGDPE